MVYCFLNIYFIFAYRKLLENTVSQKVRSIIANRDLTDVCRLTLDNEILKDVIEKRTLEPEI